MPEPIRLLLTDTQRALAKTVSGGLDPARVTVKIGAIQTIPMRWCNVALPLTIADQVMMQLLFPHLSGRKFLGSPALAMRRCVDKKLFADFMAEAGFSAHLPLPGAGTSGRVAVKPRIGAAGNGVRLVPASDVGDLPGGHVAHAWIDSETEYAAHLVFDGRIRFSRGVKYTRPDSSHIKRGPEDTPMDFVGIPAPVLDVFTSILAKLGFKGICCVDYFMVGDRPVVLEINSRLGGSLLTRQRELAALIEAYCAALTDPK